VRHKSVKVFGSNLQDFTCLYNSGLTLTAIAAALNREHTPGPRGGQWSAVQVKRILDSAF
jgi:hypothetical protein